MRSIFFHLFLLALFFAHAQPNNSKVSMEVRGCVESNSKYGLQVEYNNISNDTIYMWVGNWKLLFYTPTYRNLLPMSEYISYRMENIVFVMDSNLDISNVKFNGGAGIWYANDSVNNNEVKVLYPNSCFSIIFEIVIGSEMYNYLSKKNRKINFCGFNAFIDDNEMKVIKKTSFYSEKEPVLKPEKFQLLENYYSCCLGNSVPITIRDSMKCYTNRAILPVYKW